MQYTVTPDQQAQVITVKAKGDWDGEQDDVLLAEIFEAIAATGIRKILVDARDLRNIDLSTMQLYDEVRALQAVRRKMQVTAARVAILYDTRVSGRVEQFRFFETITRNRGMPYRLFEDLQQAIDWLAGSQAELSS